MENKNKFRLIISVLAICIAFSWGIRAEKGKEQVNDTLQNNRNSEGSASSAKKMESEKLILKMVNEETLDISVRNKESGYEWNSAGADKNKNLNERWRNFACSGVTISYYDGSGKLDQASLADMGNEVQVTYKNNGFRAEIDFSDYKISFVMNVTIDGDGLDIEIPYESIKETRPDRYRLASITVYPFLGASKGQVDGQMLIPDGSGAVIDLTEKTIATQPFVARFYGDDVGIQGESSLVKNNNTSALPETLSMPVYGVSYNGRNACMTYLKKGSEYAELHTYLAGITTEYNFSYASFLYRESYMKTIGEKSSGVHTVQKDKNRFDLGCKMIFISGENVDYTDMAVRYRQELLLDGTMTENHKKNDKAVMRVEFFMADNAKSMLGKEVIKMSSASFCNKAVKEFLKNGMNRLAIGLKGYTEGGITDSYPRHLGFEKDTGSSDDYQELIETAKENHIPLAPDTDFVKAYQNSSGYSKSNVARTIAEQFISLGGREFDKYYVLSPAVTKELFDEQKTDFKKYGIGSLGFNSMGDILYSSYISKPASRTETIEIYRNILKDSGFHNLVYRPNQYLWKYTESAANIPMTSSGYLITTEAVPFMQMVLKGNIQMFISPKNLNDNGIKDVLQMIDYGVYPAYLITENSPIELFRTESSNIFTSQYSVWKTDMESVYQSVIPALKEVEGVGFTDRKKLADEVYMTEYDNGVSFIINYSNKDFEYEGITVKAESFVKR